MNIFLKHCCINLFVVCLSTSLINAQTVKVLTSGSSISLRGLSVPDNQTVWVSGSQGTVGRSIDGGNTWKWIKVKGFEKTDFRDIEAFDGMNAIIMGVDAPAYILRTIDGGENWQVVYENKTAGMFLDAMEFWNEQSGIVIGDPINHHFYIARTFDGGKSWQEIPEDKLPIADTGEACFASSGTNIRKLNNKEALFISGGLHSNLFVRSNKIHVPIIQGKESTGGNSIAVKNQKTWIVVGGDFTLKNDTSKNCFITIDAGKSWIAPQKSPPGYRSCVEYLNKKKWSTCGLSGVDRSIDDGLHWKTISTQSFHVCRKAKKGKAVYLAGGGGYVGKLLEE